MASKRPAAPSIEKLSRDVILDDIVKNIDSFRTQFKNVDFDAFKTDVLNPVIAHTFDPEVQIRGYLRALRRTPHFKEALAAVGDEKLQAQIGAFADGKTAADAVVATGFEPGDHRSPGVKQHFSLLKAIKGAFLDCLHVTQDGPGLLEKRAYLKNLPIIYEDEAKRMVMEVYSSVPFENWGHSVSNTPAYTAVPTTVLGVQNLVRYAGEKGLRVRAAGYRHSWAPVFGQTGQVLVSFVDIETAVTLPDPITIAGDPPAAAKVAELKSIEPGAESGGKKLVRVGAGVTSETLRRWQLANGWVLPVDTVLVEVTMGGITQGLCHGAGRAHKAIADYVRRIEYVDCKGKLQSVDDPRQLLAAAGNFGLFGIVTHVTFELDRMSYALMKPRKIDISLAIPPLDKNDIPPALRPSWFASPDASTRLATATAEFETRALNDYYSEWFWCPYQAKSWVHTWNPTPDSTGVTGYPDEGLTFLEWIQGWIAGVLTGSPFFNALPGYWQAQLLATSEMAILPPTLGESAEPTIKTALPNALHFRRGVQNMRVRNMEFLIPLPPSKDDPSKPDLGVARRAWWDVIKLLYAEPKNPLDPSSPMRLLLEMRIIGDSDLLLAPMQGNTFGTAAIEVLTVPDAVDDNEWQGFLQTVADKWLATGEGLQVRPHLAKEWDGLTFKGVDARTYLRDVAMKEQIAVWKTAAAEIGAVQGWTVDEMRARFSNQLWDELMFK